MVSPGLAVNAHACARIVLETVLTSSKALSIRDTLTPNARDAASGHSQVLNAEELTAGSAVYGCKNNHAADTRPRARVTCATDPAAAERLGPRPSGAEVVGHPAYGLGKLVHPLSWNDAARCLALSAAR